MTDVNQAKLNQLEMLVAVADTGGFGTAAAELGCTQSRISHAISELEAILGTRLLLRSRSGCVPTEAGFRVLATARQVQALANSLVTTAQQDATTSGRVRIACFRSIGTHLLPQVLAALALEYPGIRVDTDDSLEEREDVERAVTQGRADIGIAQLPVAAALASWPYVADSYVLVAPASLALREPVSWAQLRGVPYLQLDCTGALAVLAQCRAAGFDAECSRTLTTDTGIVAMVRHGVGYSILPRLAVFPAPDGVRLAALPIPAPRQFALIALPERARLKAVQIVLRFARNKRIATRGAAFRAGHLSW